MYSIVMLTAMSAGADVTPPVAPAPHAVQAPVMAGCSGAVYMTGCTGCSGCYGSCYGCNGCNGGFFGKRAGGFFGGKHSCNGCSGYSCSGYNCFGSCSGSCHGACYGYSGSGYITSYGITGGAPIGSPYGISHGYSCAGTCHGGALVIYGSSWGPPIGMPPYSLHGYHTGVAPVWGAGAPVVIGRLADSNAVYGNTYYPNLPPDMTIPVAPNEKKPGSDTPPMGANLKFKVPAETKLYVDGNLAPGTGPERVFYTPVLTPGKKFFYEVKAEVVVNGKTITEEKRVIVEAGMNLTEDFAKLTAAIANPDTVAGK